MFYRKKQIVVMAVFFMLTTLYLSNTARADERLQIDRLILNGGGSIQLLLSSDINNYLKITGGYANKVPHTIATSTDLGGNIVELDIDTRTFSFKTNAKQVFISGAHKAEISGINTRIWGSFDLPALYLDRDCVVTLRGSADDSITVQVHPLARVSLDARKVSTPEIRIIGNASTTVLRSEKTNVIFYMDETKPATRTSGSGIDNVGTNAAPPLLPSAPTAPPTPIVDQSRDLPVP